MKEQYTTAPNERLPVDYVKGVAVVAVFVALPIPARRWPGIVSRFDFHERNLSRPGRIVGKSERARRRGTSLLASVTEHSANASISPPKRTAVDWCHSKSGRPTAEPLWLRQIFHNKYRAFRVALSMLGIAAGIGTKDARRRFGGSSDGRATRVTPRSESGRSKPQQSGPATTSRRNYYVQAAAIPSAETHLPRSGVGRTGQSPFDPHHSPKESRSGAVIRLRGQGSDAAEALRNRAHEMDALLAGVEREVIGTAVTTSGLTCWLTRTTPAPTPAPLPESVTERPRPSRKVRMAAARGRVHSDR